MTHRFQAFPATRIDSNNEESNEYRMSAGADHPATYNTRYNTDTIMEAQVERRRGISAMTANGEELFRSSSSNCQYDNNGRGPAGEAELYVVVEGGESALLQRGEFALVLVRHSRLPGLAAVEAMVGDVQWPVGRDCPTLRVGRRSGMKRFAFSLPGLTYGLVLDYSISAAQTQTLESLLTQYSMFDVLEDIDIPSALQRASPEMETAEFWSRLAGEVETRSWKVREKMTRVKPEPLNQHDEGDMNIKGPPSTTTDGNNKEDDPHNWRRGQRDAALARTTKRIQKARRMSAIAKLFSRTLVRGAIHAPGHVTLGCEAQLAARHVALADVNAVAMVAEAIESAGATSSSSSLASSSSGDADILQPSTWTLNRQGRRMLVGAIATFLGVRPPPSAAASSTPGPRACSTSAESPRPAQPRLR